MPAWAPLPSPSLHRVLIRQVQDYIIFLGGTGGDERHRLVAGADGSRNMYFRFSDASEGRTNNRITRRRGAIEDVPGEGSEREPTPSGYPSGAAHDDGSTHREGLGIGQRERARGVVRSLHSRSAILPVSSGLRVDGQSGRRRRLTRGSEGIHTRESIHVGGGSAPGSRPCPAVSALGVRSEHPEDCSSVGLHRPWDRVAVACEEGQHPSCVSISIYLRARTYPITQLRDDVFLETVLQE